MRVVLAPDSFGGTLTAVEAAEAMADGWRAAVPDVEIDLAPVSDGGPGRAQPDVGHLERRAESRAE